MSTLELRDVEFQDNLRSKPVRDNFIDIASYANGLQNQIDNIVSSGTLAEVVNARDYASVLRDRLRGASKITGNALISGGAVVEQTVPNMTVKVQTGSAIVDGIYCEWTESSSGTITAPSTNPRYDVVVINSDNTKSVITGTENASPTIPTWLSSQKILAHIYLTVGMTTIETADITLYTTRKSFENCTEAKYISLSTGGLTYSQIVNAIEKYCSDVPNGTYIKVNGFMRAVSGAIAAILNIYLMKKNSIKDYSIYSTYVSTQSSSFLGIGTQTDTLTDAATTTITAINITF